MHHDDSILVLRRRHLRLLATAAIVTLALVGGRQLSAQKVQDDFGDKFKVATEEGGLAIATSADGKYVYVAGKKGLIVSDDHGKTGTWVQTLRLK